MVCVTLPRVWVSPLFPPMSQGRAEAAATVAGDPGFKHDLLVCVCVCIGYVYYIYSVYVYVWVSERCAFLQEYLKVYGGRELDDWRQSIRDHNLSSARYIDIYVQLNTTVCVLLF